MLNAFRHHSGSHPTLAQGKGLLQMVLNAFRHHSGSHSGKAPEIHTEVEGCSTPFGITAVLTRRQQRIE